MRWPSLKEWGCPRASPFVLWLPAAWNHPEAPCAGAAEVEAPAPGAGFVLNISLLLALLPPFSVPLWVHRGVRAAELVHKAGALQDPTWGSWCPSQGASSCSGEGTLGSFLPWQLHLCSSPGHLHPSLPSAHFFLICTFFCSWVFVFLVYLCFFLTVIDVHFKNKCFKLKSF